MKNGKTLRLLGYTDYSKEHFMDALDMLRAHFPIVTTDPVISEHIQQMEAYLWEELEKQLGACPANIADMAVAYFVEDGGR